MVHGPLGAAKLERHLDGAAKASLAAAGHSWASAVMDGQVVHLSGVAPDEAARRSAINVALKAVGPGGGALGGVTRVDSSAIRIAPPPPKYVAIEEYKFEAAYRDGVLTFGGMTPNDDARAALVGAFSTEKSFTLSDKTALGPIADEAAWLSAASAGMQALSLLDHGDLRQQGATFSLSGATDDAAKADAAESLIAGAGGDFAFAVAIERPAAPDTVALAEVDPKACQAAINRAMNGRRLTFRQDSARLSANDRAFLDSFAGQIDSCMRQTIIIEGHTDSEGSRAANFALSKRRAGAVKAYLDGLDPAASFEVKAYGETRPIASNRTQSGQSRNRRIDFVVDAGGGESD